MNRSLRHVTRSPFLRIMAVFAWLLLVVLPVHGALPAMNGGTHAMDQMMGAMSSMSMMTSSTMGSSTGHDHDQHTASAKVQAGVEDCCSGGDGKHGGVSICHCASTASSAMAAVGMIELPPMLPADIDATPRHVMAPDIAHGPPLRPPAA